METRFLVKDIGSMQGQANDPIQVDCSLRWIPPLICAGQYRGGTQRAEVGIAGKCKIPRPGLAIMDLDKG